MVGVLIDPKRNFKDHINFVTKSIEQFLQFDLI